MLLIIFFCQMKEGDEDYDERRDGNQYSLSSRRSKRKNGIARRELQLDSHSFSFSHSFPALFPRRQRRRQTHATTKDTDTKYCDSDRNSLLLPLLLLMPATETQIQAGHANSSSPVKPSARLPSPTALLSSLCRQLMMIAIPVRRGSISFLCHHAVTGVVTVLLLHDYDDEDDY
jgi:hypothetical protein